jgi:hypothetical protein
MTQANKAMQDKTAEQLSAYLDGELSADERRFLPGDLQQTNRRVSSSVGTTAFRL